MVRPDGIYVDGTFGRGGHSRIILQALGENGRLLIFDKDPEAVEYARNLFAADRRVVVVHGSFALLGSVLAKRNIPGCDGLLLDLGVSSPQLDDSRYGFSFSHDGTLDMRMDRTTGISAARWLHEASRDELARVIREYGEERYAGRIATAIVRAREQEAIERTGQLARIIAGAVPTRERKKDPATRTFQAIRIHINNELQEISSVLEQAVAVLNPGGRLVVISFHSLEDRLVKRFLQHRARGDFYPRDIPVRASDLKPDFKIIGKAVKPTPAEVEANPRARSAVLRIGERLAA